MKKLLLILCTIIATTAGAEEFKHSSYRDAFLADVAAGMEIDPRASFWFDASHAKYRSEVTYTGAIRPIDPNIKRLITLWATALQHPESVPAVFNHEVQVSQAGQTYWMPIQDVLVKPWRKEMRAGTQAEVFLLLMGAYERVPVFTVASFTSLEPMPPYDEAPLSCLHCSAGPLRQLMFASLPNCAFQGKPLRGSPELGC